MMLKTNEDLVDTVCDMVRCHMWAREERRKTEMHPQEEEIYNYTQAQKNAAEQAKELRVETCTEANVGETHESRLRHMVAIMDEADAKTILDVLVIKHPFTVIDALKEYFLKMDRDLKDMRRVFTIRESKESEVCREDEVM